MADLSGTNLGNYQLISKIGRGGMAEVYRGYHAKLDRHVAVKILHGYLADGEDFLARFEREAQSVATLRHDHIVQIYDFDVQDDQYYMVMEFIDGGTLGDWMTANPGMREIDRILPIFEQIASALDYAHSQGIIHRDIKPSNILIDQHSKIFLTDFGIARMMSGVQAQFTATGALIGTPAYMSPEQCKGEEVSPVSDIYSLGVILFELITNQQPFKADTPLSVLQKHIMEPIPNLNNLHFDQPKSIDLLINKSLAKSPSTRYQSAGEFVSALRETGKKNLSVSEDTIQMLEDETTLETIVMEAEETLQSESTFKPTVVIEPDISVPEPKETTSDEEEPERIADLSDSPTVQKKPIPWKIIAPIAALIIIIAILFFSGMFAGTSCNSPEECAQLAGEVMERGDAELAILYMDQAIDRVPPDEHMIYAWLWCDRGHFLNALERPDEGAESFNICDAWERGE